MNNKLIAFRLESKYSKTRDIYVYTSNPRKQAGYDKTIPHEKRVVELQLGANCFNLCAGCHQIRPHFLDREEHYLLRPDSIDRVFSLLGIHTPASSDDRWRIQISGANTEPLVGGDDKAWKRLFEIGAGHTFVIHTSAINRVTDFQRIFRLYFDSPHFHSDGNMVLALSLDAPVYSNPNPDRMNRNIGYYNAKFWPPNARQAYLDILANAQWLKEILERLEVTAEKFTIIAKQLVFLEDKGTGRHKKFSIDDEDSLENVRNAIWFWAQVAHLYRLSPAYIYNFAKRIPLQEKFERWMKNLKDSFGGNFPDIDIAYRRFISRPERTDRSGVSMFQYTTNPVGLFTPCDYSSQAIPGLSLSIHSSELTKEMVDSAYASLSYKGEPCKSCGHHTCSHDSYGEVQD